MPKKRKDYSDEMKWNVKDLFATEEDFENEFKALEQELPKYKKYQGHILENATTLYEVLKLDMDVSKRLERLYIYGHIQNDQDTTDTHYQTLYGRVAKLNEKYVSTVSFITPEILKQEYSLIEKYIEENPKLKEYERLLKEIFKFKEHTLGDKEEQILSDLSASFSTPDDVYSVLSDADLKFGFIKDENGKKEELTEKSYRKFIESPNRSVRKRAFQQLFKTYGDFKNTYAY